MSKERVSVICKGDIDYCLSNASSARTAIEGIKKTDSETLVQIHRAEKYLEYLTNELGRIRLKLGKEGE